MKIYLATALAVCASISPQIASSAKLNDTGLSRCKVDYSSSTTTTVCAGTGQDAEYGRDATNPSGTDGMRGFSFRKVCNNGELSGVGTCSTSAVLGFVNATDWGCTKDRVTGLTWKLSIHDGTFYDASNFASQANYQGVCGATNWRLPTRTELQGLVHYGIKGALKIDTTWFPSIVAGKYWTSDQFLTASESAVIIDFLNEPYQIEDDGKDNFYKMILVHK